MHAVVLIYNNQKIISKFDGKKEYDFKPIKFPLFDNMCETNRLKV